jgi:rhodanese-related sulfurtransferase
MNLTQEDWVSHLEGDANAVILDVRTEDEYNEGIISNAINIDIHKGAIFVSEIEALDKSKIIMSTVAQELEAPRPVK